MSSFWTKLQISGVFLPQNGQPKNLLRRSLDVVPSVRDPRCLWSWRRGGKRKSDSKADCPRKECGKPLPERPKLCNPDCGSKCLQIKNCDEETVREKLSNCREPENIEKPMSYWEIIFGRKDEDPPDPRVCRRTHRQRQLEREGDPRLCDPRYVATPGDVLVFTEAPRWNIRKSREAQPQPPPVYKLPKAVLTKNFAVQAEKIPYVCAAALQFSGTCGAPKCSAPNPSSLPYEEFKPVGRRRKVFSCKDGVRPADVIAPIRRDANNCAASSSFHPEHYRERPAKSYEDWKPSERNSPEFSQRCCQRYSRIEQLKRQTRAKQCNQYSDLLSSGFEQVSQCQQSPCRPPS